MRLKGLALLSDYDAPMWLIWEMWVVTVGGRGQLVLTQSSTRLVNSYGYMFVSVRVDTDNDPDRM